MSRRSPFVIELTKEEQAELDARSKEYTSPYRDVDAGQDRAPGEPGAWQRPHRRTSGHAAPNRQQVASALLLRAAAGPRRAAARRATSPLFPPVLWLRSRRLLVSCRRVAACPWHDGLSPNCDRRQWRAVLWQKSVARRSGAGLARTHCVRGAIAAGYSRAIRSLPAKPAVSSISTNVGGKVQRWGRAITYSASTRRPASRPGGANIVHCHQPRGARSMLSTNTPEPARWPTSLRGTCSEPSFLVAASARTASPPSSASSFRSCAGNRIVRRVACS